MIRLGLLLCIFAKLATSLEDRVINIDQGPVRGYRPKGEDYFEYYGIPYATAPPGENKFSAPLPAPKWKKTLEAVQNFVVCPQGERTRNGKVVNKNPKYKTQEDCLIANIFVPDTNKTSLPVLVFFHGGAYQFTYGAIRSPTHLLKSKKLVIVNFNYRLGPHGFLSLGTKDIPGNAAMKDQLALLRWVKKNIAKFGGNPNDVTIDGWDAGGSSVDLMMLSKAAKGLFHKVIPESGNSVSPRSVQIDPLANAKKFASQLGCADVNNLKKLEAFYKNLSYDKLFSIDFDHSTDSSTGFGPCVEPDVGQERFLDDYPINILKSGNFAKLPMLYGISKMEGVYRIDDFKSSIGKINKNFTQFLPMDLKFKDKEDQKEVENKIKKFYFHDKEEVNKEEVNKEEVNKEEVNKEEVNKEKVNKEDAAAAVEFVQYYTDIIFAVGAARCVELQVAAGNKQVYLYQYEFVDKNEPYIKNTHTRGAGHTAGNYALMDSGDESTLSPEYKKMKKVVRDLWLNFITTGNPVVSGSSYPKWPAVKGESLNYMVLNSTLSVKPDFHKESLQFWHKIYKNHYKHPIAAQN